MASILIKDTTREERIRIVHQALWGACGIDCEFCSGCDNRGGGRTESIYQPYIDGEKEIRESALPSSVDDRSGETRNTRHYKTQLKRLPARSQAPGSLLYFTTRTESLYI